MTLLVAYMNQPFRWGALHGATPDDAYFVNCDEG
jgi:hypothetical protein